LTKAIQAEKKAEPLLAAAEYNHLAILGASVWDVSTTERFVNKAVNNATCTPVDRFYSYVILGHAKFSLLPRGAEFTRVDSARQEFRRAVALLQTESTTDFTRAHLGECYAILAGHEGYLGNSIESEEAWGKAVDSWSRLANAGELKSNWDPWVQEAHHGFKPSIASLFMMPVRALPAAKVPEDSALGERSPTSRPIPAEYLEQIPPPPKKDGGSAQPAKTSSGSVK
jgi:hypothetical protein